MGLSRTAKILLAALLVAAAGFAWINFFNQDQFADTPQPPPVTTPSVAAPSVPAALLGQGSETPAAAGSEDAGVTGSVDAAPDAVVVGDEADGAGAVTVTTGDDTATVTEDAVVVTPEPAVDVSAPPVVVTQAPTVVTRDLVVGDLPFLVTSPPVAETVTTEDSTAGANRPAATQRASVNPFSPIIVQSPTPTAVFAQEPEDVIEIVTDAGQPAAVITDVPVTSAGSSTTSASTTAVAPPPAAPAPRTVAPATSSAAALPRPLPSGTLPVTPEILREARAPQQVAETPTPVDLGTLAAIRVPDEPEPQEPLPTTDSGEPDDTQTAVTTPDVLGTDRPNEPAAVAPEPATTVTPAPTLPLAVGGDPLSRYLRDNNVRFTGSVLGPLSVGVFRSARFTEPVVLTLGQTLPDTDIILSDLRGYEARFSLGDTTQTLSLDLRR